MFNIYHGFYYMGNLLASTDEWKSVDSFSSLVQSLLSFYFIGINGVEYSSTMNETDCSIFCFSTISLGCVHSPHHLCLVTDEQILKMSAVIILTKFLIKIAKGVLFVL